MPSSPRRRRTTWPNVSADDLLVCPDGASSRTRRHPTSSLFWSISTIFPGIRPKVCLPTPRSSEHITEARQFVAPTPSRSTPVIVSEARISANRKNASLSTGPRTEQGKMNSRANSLKHGLCASACVPEDLEQIRETLAGIRRDPQAPERAARLDGRRGRPLFDPDRSVPAELERRIRDKISLRAELTWDDDDRRFEAEVLGRSLSEDPATTVEAAAPADPCRVANG